LKSERYLAEFQKRRQVLISFLEESSSMGIFSAAVQFASGKNPPKALELFERMLAIPFGDMFFVYALIATYLYNKDSIPSDLKGKIRQTWATYTAYRGDTENHWLLYYTSIYLAVQEFRNKDDSAWFNGKSSEENFDDARGWIDNWMNTTTTIGQGEFDSPTYHAVFLTPMLLLYDFAEDPEMKKKAEIMLDYLFADFAVEYLGGIYCGAHSRDYPQNVVEPKTSPMTVWGYLYFGGTEFPLKSRDYGMPLMSTYSGYRLPNIIYDIAIDRNNHYIHTETKRVRNIMRFGLERNPPVYKYTYMTRNYCLGSMQGGILQPIQQHTWDLTYLSNGNHNRVFTVNPCMSGRELGMFFPEEMRVMVEIVSKAHTYYDSEDKWSSSSPYERTFQHKNAIIVLYNVEPGAAWEHIDAFFPKHLEERLVDSSGWIFCREGKTFIAYYPLKPYQWIEDDICFRLRSTERVNGCVLEVASSDEFESIGGFEGFKAKIRFSQPYCEDISNNLTVRHRTFEGDELCFSYDGERLLNGKRIEFGDYQLFKGPFLNSDVGSKKLIITHGSRMRVLDLNELIIEDSEIQQEGCTE
jgi:hypothetical protein